MRLYIMYKQYENQDCLTHVIRRWVMYVQEISIFMRLYITYQAVLCRDALPPTAALPAFTLKSFGRDFLEMALCPLLCILPMGFQLRLLPNIVTTLGMLAIILRRTAWFCSGPLAEPLLAARFELGAPLAKRVANILVAPVAWPTSGLLGAHQLVCIPYMMLILQALLLVVVAGNVVVCVACINCCCGGGGSIGKHVQLIGN